MRSTLRPSRPIMRSWACCSRRALMPRRKTPMGRRQQRSRGRRTRPARTTRSSGCSGTRPTPAPAAPERLGAAPGRERTASTRGGSLPLVPASAGAGPSQCHPGPCLALVACAPSDRLSRGAAVAPGASSVAAPRTLRLLALSAALSRCAHAPWSSEDAAASMALTAYRQMTWAAVAASNCRQRTGPVQLQPPRALHGGRGQLARLAFAGT
mmetsp:Transcript_85720/g.266799  ORF Transcript_85720/g.266799 Transcript_85720/m.266799 type:complete len:211 (-) Transcript_85720:94-726(-)